MVKRALITIANHLGVEKTMRVIARIFPEWDFSMKRAGGEKERFKKVSKR